MIGTPRNLEIKLILNKGYKLAERASELTALQLFYLDVYELEIAVPVDQKPGVTFTPTTTKEEFIRMGNFIKGK